MSKRTHNFKVGDYVDFRPTHQTNMKRTGWVDEVFDEHNVIDVALEPGRGEISRVYQANAADCQLIAEQKPRPSKKAEEKADKKETERVAAEDDNEPAA
jgi:hypothetical protein